MKQPRLTHKTFLLAGGLMCLATLGACTGQTYMPSQTMPERVSVEEGRSATTLATEAVDRDALAKLANHYRRYGKGPVGMTITYQKWGGDSRHNGHQDAAWATLKAEEFSNILRGQEGIKDVQVNIMPLKRVDTSRTIVHYHALSAAAPEGCEKMLPGYDHRKVGDTKHFEDYKYGCSIESLIARQIADPSDLLGREGLEGDNSGRRQGNIVEGSGYYSGQPNPPLGGESVSGD